MSEVLFKDLALLTECREGLELEWRRAVVALVDSGVSLRRVAEVAGVSHMTVSAICRKAKR